MMDLASRMRLPGTAYGQLLRRYLAPQRAAAGLMAFCLLTGILLQVAGPPLVRSFLEAAGRGEAQSVLMRTALAFLAVSALAQVLTTLAAFWSQRIAWEATNALRSDLVAHLLGLDPAFFQERTPGELIERVDGDVAALAGFFSSLVVELAGSLLLLAGVLAVVTWVSPWLGLAFGCGALVALGAMGRMRGVAARSIAADREESARHYGFLGEVLTGTEDLRSSGAADWALEQAEGRLRRWMPVALRASALSSLLGLAAFGAIALLDGLAYGMGARLFLTGAVSGGTVYMVVAYAAQLAQPLERIRRQLEQLQRADAAIARVQRLLAIRPALVDGTEVLPAGAPGAVAQTGGAQAVCAAGLAVRFDQVCFAYGNEAVLHDVSFSLAPGQVLGMAGRTGSGKSTLARLLFRFYDPQAGRVELGGVDIRRLQRRSLRSRVGLVTQEVQLFAATLRENITLFDDGVPAERIVAALEAVGLGPWLAALPDGLDTPIAPGAVSGGQAQLLAFARVFLQDPGLVILDEASSRLDPATEAQVERALDRLLAGRTAIIIAHRPATLERADLVLVMENGKVAEFCPRQTLRTTVQQEVPA